MSLSPCRLAGVSCPLEEAKEIGPRGPENSRLKMTFASVSVPRVKMIKLCDDSVLTRTRKFLLGDARQLDVGECNQFWESSPLLLVELDCTGRCSRAGSITIQAIK